MYMTPTKDVETWIMMNLDISDKLRGTNPSDLYYKKPSLIDVDFNKFSMISLKTVQADFRPHNCIYKRQQLQVSGPDQYINDTTCFHHFENQSICHREEPFHERATWRSRSPHLLF